MKKYRLKLRMKGTDFYLRYVQSIKSIVVE